MLDRIAAHAESGAEPLIQALALSNPTVTGALPCKKLVLAPNVKINWRYQFGRHFSFFGGVKLGTAISANGTSSSECHACEFGNFHCYRISILFYCAPKSDVAGWDPRSIDTDFSESLTRNA